MTHDRFAHIAYGGARRPLGLAASFMWLGGLIATAAAVTVGALLAVFAAAAVAVMAVFGSVLLFLAGLAMRARRTLGGRQRRAGDLIEARKVDGAWVAYGWERPGR